MPQIWLSMEELAELLGEPEPCVRDAAIRMRRKLRPGSDGSLHLLLSDAMAEEYIRIRCDDIVGAAAPVAQPVVTDGAGARSDLARLDPPRAPVPFAAGDSRPFFPTTQLRHFMPWRRSA